jgi:excisionase family DNA binding protein
MTSSDSRQARDHPQVLLTGGGDGRKPFAPRAYRITEVCKASGLGRTTIYAAIKSGDLSARKCGRATIVLADDLETFLRNLPAMHVRA